MDNDNTPHRRRFLQVAALGAGASLLSAGVATTASAAGNVDTLLLSCMDFRLMDDIERYMHERGLRGNYDHIILGGASLGALTDKYPAWNKTFWEHLDVAIQLHRTKRLMVLDHRDCGAYKVILNEDFHKNPSNETATHARYLKELGKAVAARYPTLKVELLLMDLQGKVETLA